MTIKTEDNVLHNTKTNYTQEEAEKFILLHNRQLHIGMTIFFSIMLALLIYMSVRTHIHTVMAFVLSMSVFLLTLKLFYRQKIHSLLKELPREYEKSEFRKSGVIEYNFYIGHVQINLYKIDDPSYQPVEIKYGYFERIFESETNFYFVGPLINESEQAFITVIKENCTSELIEFIQNLPNSTSIYDREFKFFNKVESIVKKWAGVP